MRDTRLRLETSARLDHDRHVCRRRRSGSLNAKNFHAGNVGDGRVCPSQGGAAFRQAGEEGHGEVNGRDSAVAFGRVVGGSMILGEPESSTYAIGISKKRRKLGI